MEFPASIAQRVGLGDAGGPGEMWMNVQRLEVWSLSPSPLPFPALLRHFHRILLRGSPCHLLSSSPASH